MHAQSAPGSGSDQKPNRLIKETSPYLLQHAYNPVDWYSWGDEPLMRAKSEDKPIFLSIGYSACHWCHVMSHESFEDDDVARTMNENFVNIKVDREERPDIDDVYQRVCQLATGTGGWPLSIFLTPDQRPFYAGTYFPKDSGTYGRPGFMTILNQLSEAYRNKKHEIQTTAEEFMRGLVDMAKDVLIMRSKEGEVEKTEIEKSVLDEAAVGLLQMGDPVYGGLGQAPKFPNTSSLLYLLRYYDLSGINRFKDFVMFTADKMAAGGIHDHLGGGFARYSTDQRWLVPHFEKMLYDNALLAQLYAELYQISANKKYLGIVKKTLDYIMQEMTDPHGGFYSAQDADSEGEEGKFYVWSKKEIASALAPDVGDIFCEYYGVTEGGNFEGKNILNVRQSKAELAKRHGKTEQWIEEIIRNASEKLFAVRKSRVKPGRDEKILTSWNGLMISGFAKGYSVSREEQYRDAAVNAIRFIENRLSDGNRLKRTFKDGEAKLNGYLDDYAFYVSGLLDMFAIDSKIHYLERAIEYTDFMLQHFWDEKDKGLYFTSDDHEKLIVRTKNFYDLAIPSGNSMATLNLLRLYHFTQKNDYLQKATQIMNIGTKPAAENPFGFGQLLAAIYLYVKKPLEITIITVKKKNSEMANWLARQFLPNAINASIQESEELDKLQKYAFFKGRTVSSGETAFVCRNFTCSLPLHSAEDLERQIRPAPAKA